MLITSTVSSVKRPKEKSIEHIWEKEEVNFSKVPDSVLFCHSSKLLM